MINVGDFIILVGIWKNGKGESLIIYFDGSINIGGMIMKDLFIDELWLIISLSIRWGFIGVVLLLYKIGVENFNGD